MTKIHKGCKVKKIHLVLGVTLFIFLIYFIFFRINWELIESGNIEKIEKHLKYKSKSSLNSTNKDGYALFNVVLKTTSNGDNYNLIKVLLEKDLKKKKMISPYESIVEGFGDIDKDKLDKLEKIGALLKEQGFSNFEKDSSLLKALEKENYELFETLLKIGVNPNETNVFGETSVFYIIKTQYKYDDALNEVMSRFGLRELPNKNKLAELFRADEEGQWSTELLTVKKAMEFYEVPTKMLDLLNSYGVNPNIPNNDGVMPIAYVFEKGNKVYFNKLLKFKIPVNFKIYGNYKVVFDGIKNENPIILNELYNNRLDLYQKNEKNETILNFIIREEKLNILQNLLNKNILNKKHKEFIIKYYLEEEDVKALKKINSLGLHLENPQSIFEEKINKYNKIDILVYLIDLKININAKNKNGESPLIQAINAENEALFNLLVLRNADIELQDDIGNTPLIIAVKKGNEFFINELINRGAKTGVKNIDGKDIFFYGEKNEKIQNLLKNKVKSK